jgi:PAS domain S-box-containing protein
MYYGTPRLPTRDDVQLIGMATQMARIAIDTKRDDDLLRMVFEGAPSGMLITDLGGKITRVNHAFAEMLGYSVADLHGKPIADITDEGEAAALADELLTRRRGEIPTNRRYRTRSGAVLRTRERSALRLDASGEPRFVLTYVDRMAEAGSDPIAALSPREREVLKDVVAGRTSKEIAIGLGISPASVDTYRSRIMVKLGIRDLPSLVRFAIQHGIATM